jgi:hypothetical protein
MFPLAVGTYVELVHVLLIPIVDFGLVKHGTRGKATAFYVRSRGFVYRLKITLAHLFDSFTAAYPRSTSLVSWSDTRARDRQT